MNVKVNGKSQPLDEKTCVLDLLRILNIPAEVVVVEVNRTIVDKPAFGSTVLKEGDAVEILRFVGGG